MLYGLFFLLGALTINFFQILLNMKPVYKVWKLSEFGFLKTLLQSETLRHQSLEIVRLCYEEANKLEQYDVIKDAINKKFIEFQDASLQQIKQEIPYEISYNSTKEALEWMTKKFIKGETEDV